MLARSWLATLASLHTAYAIGRDTLFTSSVTYCAPPETLLIQQLDFAYIAWNNSVFFNISAASVEPNLNVTANLLVNVYGMQPFNFTVNLCTLLNGVLCPLPMYNFTGVDWLPLPSSFAVSKKIPNIAFKIPDLEAFAQLTLLEVGTGDIKACVQSTVSNGWSARQPAVQWSTACLALITLFFAIYQSYTTQLLIPYRLIDLFLLYQSIAVSAFLNINYPSVYLSFALNFAWSMGLVFASVPSPVQNAINHIRHLTGGDMADATGVTAVGLVNRKLSPYNVVPSLAFHNSPQSLLSKAKSAFLPDFPVLASTPSPNVLSGMMQLTDGGVVTVTPASSNILQAGVPIYVNFISIAAANAFMTVFFCALILTAIALAAYGLGYICLLVPPSPRWVSSERRIEIRRAYPRLVKSWTFRMCLIAFTPITTFAIYQWTLKDSWLSLLLSVLLLATLLAYISYSVFLTIRQALHSGAHTLYIEPTHYTPLFGQYRPPRYYFFTLCLAAIIIRAMLIGFAANHGEGQVIVMVIIDASILFAYLLLRPYNSRGGHILGTYLATTRLLATGLMVAFIERFALAAIPRVVVGIIIAVLFSVSVVVIAINILMLAFKEIRSLKFDNMRHYLSRSVEPQDSAIEPVRCRSVTSTMALVVCPPPPSNPC